MCQDVYLFGISPNSELSGWVIVPGWGEGGEFHITRVLCMRWLFRWPSLIAWLVKHPPAMQKAQFDSWVRKIPWRRDRLPTPVFLGFPCGSTGKESACNAWDLGSIPVLGRSPGEGKGYPLQYSGLENSIDCIVHGVAKSWTWLSNFHFHLHKSEIASLLDKQLLIALCGSLEGLHVLLLNWAEWMRRRECLDSPHLPPPWHLVHCSSGPVISPGEWTQICSKPKHSREEGGPVSITWVPRSPEMPGSSEVSVRITHHLFLQRWRADTGVLPAPGWGICEKGYWPCFIFLSSLKSLEPKMTCLIPMEIQQIFGRK